MTAMWKEMTFAITASSTTRTKIFAQTCTKAEEDGDFKAMLKMMRTGGTEVIGELAVDRSQGSGNSCNVTIPKPDPSWAPPQAKVVRIVFTFN